MNRKNGNAARVIQYLRDHPDGASSAEIVAAVGCSRSQVEDAARRNAHVYVDRWEAHTRANGKGKIIYWRKVYCYVQPLADTPKPDRKPTEQDLP